MSRCGGTARRTTNTPRSSSTTVVSEAIADKIIGNAACMGNSILTTFVSRPCGRGAKEAQATQGFTSNRPEGTQPSATAAPRVLPDSSGSHPHCSNLTRSAGRLQETQNPVGLAVRAHSKSFSFAWASCWAFSITVFNSTGLPPYCLLSSAASINASNSSVSSAETGGLPVRKNAPICSTSGPYPSKPKTVTTFLEPNTTAP